MAAPKAKRRAKAKAAASAPAAPLADKLAEAAWAQADVALAEALADLDELETAQTEAARADALAMLSQSLTRAARRRGLSRVGELGAAETFDPDRHELNGGGARPAKKVLVQARGIARGEKILVLPRVIPLPRKRP